jgi:predicted nuclease of predicted toxin-antitoxin system
VTLAFYFDQHVPGPVAAELRRRGIDVLTTEADRTKGLPDEALLERATALNRIMVSNDDDFLVIAAQWRSSDRHFAGLIRLRDQRLPYGKLLEDLLMIAEVYSADEMVDRIEYLPL